MILEDISMSSPKLKKLPSSLLNTPKFSKDLESNQLRELCFMVHQVVVKLWWQKPLPLKPNLILLESKVLNFSQNMLVTQKKLLETFLNVQELAVLASYFLTKSMPLQLKDLQSIIFFNEVHKYLIEYFVNYWMKWMGLKD